MPRLNRRLRQGTTARPLRILVAAPQPLHRELVRFFLEEAGCNVVALVASGEDAVSLVTSKRPDAVILHESLTAKAGTSLIQRIRQGSTSTKILVVTPQPEQAWSGPSRGADAFVEEWVGIQELGILLHRLCRGAPLPARSARVQPESGGVGSSPAAGQGEGLPLPPRAVDPSMGWQARWYERLRGAAVASVVLILLLLGGGRFHLFTTSEGSGSAAASAHLTNAYSTLEVLVASMRGGMSTEAIAENARRLLAERAAALASGADTTRLDAAIDAEVSPLLPNVTDEGAAAVQYVLGDLVSNQGPPPSPEPAPAEVPSPEPSPTETSAPKHSPSPDESPTAEASPSPEPSETPSPEPSPTETPRPHPSPRETPNPSETPSPTESPSPSDSPSPTQTPSPSESPSPTQTPSPSESPSPTETPSPSQSPTPTGTPNSDVSPTESPSSTQSPSPSESQSPEPSESVSPSTPGPAAIPAIPAAAGLVFGSLPILSWMRTRVRKRP